jgi:hypothetical protein
MRKPKLDAESKTKKNDKKTASGGNGEDENVIKSESKTVRIPSSDGRSKSKENAAPFYKTVAKRTPPKVRSDKGAPHGKRGSKGSK